MMLLLDNKKCINLALEIVERKTGIGRDMILGRSRSRDIADARFMVCWIAKFQGMGLVSIARELQRTHGAIANGIEQIKNLAEFNADFRATVKSLEAQIK